MIHKLTWLIAVILLTASVVYANEPAKSLNIATTDSKPLALDRLVAEAFKETGYQASFTPGTAQTGYAWAQSGEKDGVISSNPDMQIQYPTLVQVPVALDQAQICIYTRENNNLSVESWSDLAGLNIGLLAQHTYIPSKIPVSATAVTKDSLKQLMEGLLAGEYDAAVYARHTYESINYQSTVRLAGQLETLTEYLYLNKKHIYLRDRIAKALEQLSADGRAQAILNETQVISNKNNRTILHILSSNNSVSYEEAFCADLYTYFENDHTIEWYTLSMDVKRFPDTKNRMIYFASLLRQDFLSRDLAAIVVSDDEALHFIEEYYLCYFKNVPVLFYGIDSHFDSAYYDLRANMSGVVRQLSAYDTVSEALEIFPATRKLFIVNDYSAEGVAFSTAIREQLAPYMGSLDMVYNENVDLTALLQTIRDLSSDSMVLWGSYFVDADGQYYSPNDLSRYMIRDCAVPSFSLTSATLSHGSVGGKCPDYPRYAEEIAGMLSQLLDGEAIGNIPVIFDSTGLNTWVFDQLALNRFHVNKSTLPKDAVILNAVPSVWQTNPRIMFGGIAIFTFSLGFMVYLLFLQYNLRKKNDALQEMQSNLSMTRELLAKETSLNEVRDRLERLINIAPVAYALTIDGIIAETNGYMQRHVGMKKGEPILPYYTFPEQRDAMVEKLIGPYGEGGSNVVISLNTADGTVRRFMASFTSVEFEGKKAFMLWVMDIEDSERQKENTQTILDMLPIPVRVTSLADQRLVYANQACLDLFEMPSLAESYGMDTMRFLPPVQPDGTDTFEYLKQLGATDTLRIACITAGGRVFDSELLRTEIDYKGKRASLGIIKDLTAENAYKQMLLVTAEKEKEANLLKGRFLVNMSHEIRTPMNAIIGLAEIEIRKNTFGESIEVYQKISGAAKSLLNIINDILDLSKIEANKMEIIENEFELEECLSSAMLVATPRLDGKPVECLIKLALDVPRVVIGDKTRLWQITKNFLDNATKFTDRGKVTLTVSIDEQQSNDETVFISFIVADTGIGIDNEHLQRIFIPYEQIYSDAQTRYSGTGLGMVISKQLCDMMGGRLIITSKSGIGTSIYYTLPFGRAANRETQRNTLTNPVLAGKNMLVVDDDPFSLEIMISLLNGARVNCVSARSGAEALEKIFAFRDKGRVFDGILLDYVMDGLSGIETAQQIHMNLSEVPKILLVTAYQMEVTKRDMNDAGIAGIIEKPFVPSYFIQKLGAAFGYERDPSPSDAEKTVMCRFKNVRLLLCEDNKLNQEVAIGMLAQFGIRPLVADDGDRALTTLDGQPVDLVLMDLHMPGMNGYETTRMLRAHPLYEDVPIISLTADAMTEVKDQCLAAGMNDNLTKPVEITDLHKVLYKWLPADKRDEEEAAYVINGTDEDYPAIGGVAYAEGVARFGGIRDVYEKTLLSFAKNLPDEWPNYGDMLKDTDAMARNIHQLKGISGNLGVREVYRIAVAFEKSLKQNKPDERLYSLLIDACALVKAAITDSISFLTEGARETGTPDELDALLARLKKALLDYEPLGCEEIINVIKSKVWPGANEEAVKQICDLASAYEFDEAHAALLELTGEDG